MGLAVPSPQEGSTLLQDHRINRAPARAGSWAGPAELPALTLRMQQGLPQELGVESRAQPCRTVPSQGTAKERETERGPPSKLGANFSWLGRNNSGKQSSWHTCLQNAYLPVGQMTINQIRYTVTFTVNSNTHFQGRGQFCECK